MAKLIETVHKDLGSVTTASGCVVTTTISSFQEVVKGKLGEPSQPTLYVRMVRPGGWRTATLLKVRVSEIGEFAPLISKALTAEAKAARAA